MKYREDTEMFQFTEDCMIGVPEIDDQHRHLFDLINEGMQLAASSYTGDRYTSCLLYTSDAADER